MIEAVNSTVANATTVRGVVGQMDSASVPTVAAVMPVLGSDAAPGVPQAPFVSPYISVDFEFNKPVLQIRDTQTGAVKQQFPTEGRMAQIASSQAQMRVQMQEKPSINYIEKPAISVDLAAQRASQTTVQTVDVTTVQDVTATPASNTASSTPQIAVAALSAAAQSSAAASSSAGATELGVTVYA